MSRKKIARILLVLAVFASLTLTELTPLSSRAQSACPTSIKWTVRPAGGIRSGRSRQPQSSSDRVRRRAGIPFLISS